MCINEKERERERERERRDEKWISHLSLGSGRREQITMIFFLSHSILRRLKRRIADSKEGK